MIPARGGSKRIPRKNIKSFYSQPMIAWSIQAALDSHCFDEVWVSTDDQEIADIAQLYGAKVPFLRPQELSDDFATTADVMQHAVHVAESILPRIPKYICCLYATAPFVRAEDIQKGLEKIESGNLSYCFSATTFPFPIQRAIKFDDQQRVEMFYPEHFYTRSQDLEEAWHDAGQFYWGTGLAWKNKDVIFSAQSSIVELPRFRVQDIDTPEDWDRAELMANLLLKVEA